MTPAANAVPCSAGERSCGSQPGDKAPFFYGMRADGGFHSSEAQIGRPAVLILVGRRSPEAMAPWLQAFATQTGPAAYLACDILLLVSPEPCWMSVAMPDPSLVLLHCPNEELFASEGGDDDPPVVLMLDRALRLVVRLDQTRAVDAAIALQAWLKTSSPFQSVATVDSPAPILMVPNFITAAFCDALIQHFEASRHVDGAMASVDASGGAVNRIDAEKKHRRDLTLEVGGRLHTLVLDRLNRLLVPEIHKAFQARVTHIDRVLIARYDDSGGYFRPHRDNSAPQTAFRQFALSLNLNTDAYEGGDLKFPEFNDHLHRPPTGAACVFSASLLHEATPVTRGRRYVLLTFLHDDVAEAARQAQTGG